MNGTNRKNGANRRLRIMAYIGIGIGVAGLLWCFVIPLLLGGNVAILETVLCVIDLIFDIYTLRRCPKEVDEIPVYAKYQDGIPHPDQPDD